MRRTGKHCLAAVLSAIALTACASRDGISTETNVNPVTATPAGELNKAYDESTDLAADAAIGLANEIVSAPLKLLFDATGATEPAPSPTTIDPSDLETPLYSPEVRRAARRRRLGLPELPEARAAYRRHQWRLQFRRH